MKDPYGRDYYLDRHRETVYSARTILSLVLDVLPRVRSAIDIGCGVGTWLSVLKERGVPEIRGLDGPWVEQDLLEIPNTDFQQADFAKTMAVDKRFDLAISLEVAEHVPEMLAGSFIDLLASASDFVLFSAAIPFQGGSGHVNEQWPDYWAELFAARGFVTLDFLRNTIWNDAKIPFWYRQNILLFVRKDRVGQLARHRPNELRGNFPASLVHPELYLSKIFRN